MLPVGTYQVATEPLGEERAKPLLPRNRCVTDNQFVLDYSPDSDHRLLFGGGCTHLGGMPSDIRAATRPYLEGCSPQLRGVALEYAWAGIYRQIDALPDIGRRQPLLAVVTRYGVLPSSAAVKWSATRCSATTRPWRHQRLRNLKPWRPALRRAAGFPGQSVLPSARPVLRGPEPR